MIRKIDVMDYRTGRVVREGTEAELEESVGQADRDGGVGVITIQDHKDPVYVIGYSI